MEKSERETHREIEGEKGVQKRKSVRGEHNSMICVDKCMKVYVYICIHTYVQTLVNVYINVYWYNTYMYISTYIYISINTYVYTY